MGACGSLQYQPEFGHGTGHCNCWHNPSPELTSEKLGMHFGKEILCLWNSPSQLLQTSWHSDWQVYRVWPLLATHGDVSMKQASLFKLNEQLLLRTGPRLLSKDWSRVLVLFPRPLRLSLRHAGLVTFSQLGNVRSVKRRHRFSFSLWKNFWPSLFWLL